MLSPEQQSAVEAVGHTMVIACPGSGKTRVLVSKCSHILASDPSASVALVTFTRAAAREMNTRLRDAAPETAGRFVAATFHSLAIRQLLASGAAGVVLGPGDQTALLERAWQTIQPPGQFQDFLRRYEKASAAGRLVFSRSEDEEVLEVYLSLLSHHSASDLSTSIAAVLSGMLEGSVPPLSHTHILIDEFQDVDLSQLRWILAHAQSGRTITVVGDDDQSVYAFRFALAFRAFREFRRKLRPTVVHLSMNYRCRPELLQLSGSLVSINKQREPKSLACFRAPGGVARLLQYGNQLEEAEALASVVKNNPSQWAVVARSNFKLDPIESTLAAFGVPCRRPGRSDFWEHPDCVMFTSLLDTRARSFDVAFSNCLARAGISEDVIAQVVPHGYRALSTSSLSNHYLICSLRDSVVHAQSASPESAIGALFSWLSQHVFANDPSSALTTAKASLLSRRGSLTDRLRSLRFSSVRSDDHDAVTLLTMHGSKGLEFPRVWIPAVQGDVIPHHRSDDIEEERRLMYVAMTRAEDELIVSFAWNQYSDEADRVTKRLAPSSFLTVDLGFVCERPGQSVNA